MLSSKMPVSETAQMEKVLKNVFGYTSFRLNQEEIIRKVLAGKDVVVIMPTGGGKSICYQVPALIKEGLTVVVSPLIALMKDQIESLQVLGVEAAAANSSVSREKLRQIVNKIETGKLKLLYLSPEKAVTNRFLQFLKKQKLALIAIDEAHCVSIWGNDFRPEYAQLNRLTTQFPGVPKLALTATADKATREDIMKQLELENPTLFISSFERKNIQIQVQPAQDRVKSILYFLSNHKGEAGIIYCLSRKSTERLANRLKAFNINAAYYHANLPPEERSRVQDAFIRDEIQVICATIAFGMGIDKSNIRWVIHYNLPKNVESYYQEIGRAGRDGLPSESILYGGFGDVMTYRNMIRDGDATPAYKEVQLAKLERIWEFVQATSCRTNFLLSYFGEIRTEGCGHCDICLYPPHKINGTKFTQQALSAVLRSHESVGIQLLVDILRGSYRKEIQAAGYHRIKTFGIGRDLPRFNWIQYVTQMINQGILEIDYSKKSVLRVTALGKEVLQGKQDVSLTEAIDFKDSFGKKPKKRNKTHQFKEALKKRILEKRKNISNEENIVPTHMFSDTTIQEMADVVPLFRSDFMGIVGVTQAKWERFGVPFIKEIQDFVLHQPYRKTIKGKTFLETKTSLDSGLSPKEISAKRKISVSTVFTHLAYLYKNEEDIDIFQFITPREIEIVGEIWLKLGKPDQVQPVLEKMVKPMTFNKIRLALAYLERHA